MMKMTLLNYRFYIILYFILALFFLVIHLTRSERFSLVVDNLIVKGSSSLGGTLSEPRVKKIKVVFNGLEIRLLKKKKVIMITEDGIAHRLNVTSWQKENTGIRINLDYDVGLFFTKDPQNQSVIIIPDIPHTFPPVQSFQIPVYPSTNTRFETSSLNPEILLISTPNADFTGILPNASAWKPQKNMFELVISDKNDSRVKIIDQKLAGQLSSTEWINEGPIPSESLYNSTKENWISTVRRGWDSRREEQIGLRLDGNNEAGWDNQWAATFLADSLDRNLFSSWLPIVSSAANQTPQQLGWLISPYLGNIVNQGVSYARSLAAQANRLRDSLAREEVSFDLSDSLGILWDAGYPTEARAFLNRVRQFPDSEASNKKVIEKLSFLQTAQELGLEDSDRDSALQDRLLEEFFLPKIFWRNDELWLVDKEGPIDVETSFRAGTLFLAAGEKNNKQEYKTFGRQLIISALKQSDQSGVLPATIDMNQIGEIDTTGHIPPEEIYRHIAPIPFFPRRISLSNELGNGAWALTGVENFSLSSNPEITTIRVSFPIGDSHYFLIKGIKNFYQLFMNGILWNGDPNFQNYYAGWLYNASAQTLYVKIRHRIGTETIRIIHNPPPVVPEEVSVSEEEPIT